MNAVRNILFEFFQEGCSRKKSSRKSALREVGLDVPAPFDIGSIAEQKASFKRPRTWPGYKYVMAYIHTLPLVRLGRYIEFRDMTPISVRW